MRGYKNFLLTNGVHVPLAEDIFIDWILLVSEQGCLVAAALAPRLRSLIALPEHPIQKAMKLRMLLAAVMGEYNLRLSPEIGNSFGRQFLRQNFSSNDFRACT